MIPPSPVSLSSLFEQFNSSPEGLTGEEASRRLAQSGLNEPVPVKRTHGAVQFLLLLANPLIIILLLASLVSALAGEQINASIIITIVLLGITLNFVQTSRSARVIERLRETVASTATVLRDRCWSEVLIRNLVPGDIIRLTAGDLVPADGRLFQVRSLQIRQAALTGESMPVEKQDEDVDGDPSSPAEAKNMVFLGTSVISGTALALVVATGVKTAFGDVASLLSRRPPETEFERGSRKFGFLIMQTVFFLVLFVFTVTAAFHRDPLESLLFAIALAVGLTPEFFPMITSVTLSRGAVHMARLKVVVKHLASIQNLGSMDILCSDKTGTLTRGEMSLSGHLDPLGHVAEEVYFFASLNSVFETGIKSPLDSAILNYRRPDIEGYQKIDEIPFDFDRRRLSVVVEKNGERLLISKGAPEGILPLCLSYRIQGDQRPLDAESRLKVQKTFQELGAGGYRVLAVASRTIPDQKVYRAGDEKDLVLLGFMTFADPPLEDAAKAVHSLRRDGVRVMILTGDHELVARHICSAVGIDTDRVVLGEEIDRMSDSALAGVSEKVNLFARVSPGQKNRIILALKSRGHVVGFLGDGINDAPSLHAADVGISVSSGVDVAKEAAEVILLERSLRVLHQGIMEGRKAFGNVVKYLLMGTSSNFGNMFSMAGAFLFLPFLPMLPMQILLNNFLYDLAQLTIPTDHVDATFIHKPRRWDISLIRNFMLIIGPISSVYDFLTFFVLLKVFHASEALFHTGWFVESLATQTLVLLIIRTAGNPFTSRPGKPLIMTVIAVAAVGALLPFTPLAGILGFTPLPATYFFFLAGVVSTYLLIVEFAKRKLMASYLRHTVSRGSSRF
jgi:Mg2+-importing ATPase